MKCQHGQTKCQQKTSAACQYCLKKIHFHQGHSETLSIKDVQELIYSLGINGSKKQHLASLKQMIVHYFQVLKTHLSKSLEAVCKNMIDRISHSFLYNENMLDIYKKLSFQDYSKLPSIQLRRLHLLNKKITKVNLQKQQQKFYIKEVEQIKSTIEPLKKVFQIYQDQIYTYDNSFSAQSFVYKKIIQLSQKIIIAHSLNSVKQNNIINHTQQPTHHNPQISHNQKPIKQPEQPKLLSLAQYKNQKSKSTQSLKSKNNINFQLLNVARGSKQRKLSIANDTDKLSVSFFSKKSSDSDANSTSTKNNEEENLLLPLPKQLSPIQKLNKIRSKQNIQKFREKKQKFIKDISQLKVNSKNQIYQIPHKQQHQEFSIRITDPSKVGQIRQDVNQNQSLLNSQNFHYKQCNSVVLDEPLSQKSHKAILYNKKIKLPPSVDHDYANKFQIQEDIKKKVIRFQINPVNRQSIHQLQSPLYKKKYQFQHYPLRNNVRQVHHIPLSPIRKHSNDQKASYLRKNSSSEDEDLTNDQLKSLALLLESLKLPSQKALIYLRKSFQFCQQNLSTAEYMSYILLQQNHPKQCLQLCNFMINKIFANTSNYNFSIHLINNKAAALNNLGRFSQTIQFLQKILENTQKDTLYKNIADAYCALGITQKSIINYQKCISLNKQFDEAFYNLAVCFYTQNHYQQALQSVSQAIRLNPQKDQYIELYRNIKIKLG